MVSETLGTAAPEQVDTVDATVETQDTAPVVDAVVNAETEPLETTETVTAPEAKSFDDLDDDTRDRLYKGRGREARIRESERQKTEARLKRESGSKESTRDAVANIIRAIGHDPDSNVDGTTVKRAEYLYELARAHSATELATELPEAILADFKIPVEYRERAVEGLESGSKTAYVKALVEGAIAAQKGELTLNDIPEGSALRKEVDALVSERVKKELKAAKVESSPNAIDAPTPPRGGVATPITIETIKSMTPQEINANWADVQSALRG